MANSEQKPPPSPKFNKWTVVGLALQMGFIIALPLVIFGSFGKWLDGRFGTGPWLTLAGILLAIVITTIWLARRFKALMTNDHDQGGSRQS